MKKIKSPVVYILTWQWAMALPCILVLTFVNRVWAYSFACGAMIFVLSNLYFAICSFRYMGAASVHWGLNSIKRGESGKFMLSALGFALVFSFVKPLSVVALFAGFIGMVVLQWFFAARLVAARHTPE